ncbi:MAG: PIG-L family deacetylase [Verrucomicrobiota bacterium]
MSARLCVSAALLGTLAMMATPRSQAQPAETTATAQAPGAAILQDLRSFNTVATLLHVAAHPDDENTTLITYFARGRGYRTAYLSLTRGDGGQNEIGPEFDAKLGVARTQELLAARKLDGGRQFFTRAIDFGYSKSVDETLQFWDRKEVLGDVVRVIRTFRPDVIVTRFSPTAGGTHGHHTASAVLGVEAFKLAGDPKAYPEQLAQGLTVWQAKRVVLNGFGGRGGGSAPGSSSVNVNIGGKDPVTGQTFGEIAMLSRRKHITQGFANAGMRGSGEEAFLHLGGEAATQDLMDGIDTTWARVPGGAEIGQLAAAAIEQFKGEDPAASVPALLAIRKKLAALPADPVVDDKKTQLDRILQTCLGLEVQTLADQPEVVPGEKVNLEARLRVTGPVPVKWIRFSGPVRSIDLIRGETKSEIRAYAINPKEPLTQPYWLREDSAAGIARVADPKLIGLPENPPWAAIEYTFEVDGQQFGVRTEPVHITKTAKGERLRRVDVIAPAALHFVSDVSVFALGATKPVEVEVTAARAGTEGALRLELPQGWTATPASHAVKLGAIGEKARFNFVVTAPASATTGRVTVSLNDGKSSYSSQRIVIDYPHLPIMLLQPPARARLVSLDIATRGKNVGYLPGAGDDTAEALEQLGYQVTTLGGTDLTEEKLKGLDAVVIGVRAFNERKDLKPHLTALFAYVEKGGTVIAQYNRPNGLAAEPLGPYALSIQGSAPALRVTDEKAPVSFLAADHASLTTPNKIGPADFEGWVQERGAYFPSSWDKSRYTTVLAMNDPGEDPLNSSVLVAQHGKGYYVYTGVAFFRQLPAGVPGAYRLFANLVSLGK